MNVTGRDNAINEFLYLIDANKEQIAQSPLSKDKKIHGLIKRELRNNNFSIDDLDDEHILALRKIHTGLDTDRAKRFGRVLKDLFLYKMEDLNAYSFDEIDRVWEDYFSECKNVLDLFQLSDLDESISSFFDEIVASHRIQQQIRAIPKEDRANVIKYALSLFDKLPSAAKKAKMLLVISKITPEKRADFIQRLFPPTVNHSGLRTILRYIDPTREDLIDVIEHFLLLQTDAMQGKGNPYTLWSVFKISKEDLLDVMGHALPLTKMEDEDEDQTIGNIISAINDLHIEERSDVIEHARPFLVSSVEETNWMSGLLEMIGSIPREEEKMSLHTPFLCLLGQ